MLAYIGYFYHGIVFGPRYYFDALPAFVLLSARGFVALAEGTATICRDWGRQRAWPRAQAATLLLCAALIACNVAYFWPQQVRLYSHLSGRPGTGGGVLGDFVRRGISGREVRLTNAVVIVRDQGLMRIFGPLNCHRVECDPFILFSPDTAHDASVREAFPDRDLYLVVNRDGALTLDSPGQLGAAPVR